MKLFQIILLVFLASPVLAYPYVTVSGQGTDFVASAPVNSESTAQYYARSYQSNTYDYVDGYDAGYAMGAQDASIYSWNYRNHDEIVYRQIGNGFPFAVPRSQAAYYNNYNTYAVPGLDCEFGRRDICFNRYTQCQYGYCQTGDRDRATYTYYNPNSVPGLYPLSDRSGIYYVS